MTRVDTPIARPAVRDRAPLVLSGSLVLGGLLAHTAVTTFHPSREDPNDHTAVFGEYARSADWIWVHWAQWAAALIMIAGFVVLYRALTAARRASGLDTLAFAAAVTSGAAVTVLQAVDGVALKHTVDAWAAATGADKAARFADAETVRWLEWAANSFFYAALGATVALFGVAMLRSRAVPAWLGAAGVLTGAAFLAHALPVSYGGFATDLTGFVAALLLAVTAVGVLVAGIRARSGAALEEIR